MIETKINLNKFEYFVTREYSIQKHTNNKIFFNTDSFNINNNRLLDIFEYTKINFEKHELRILEIQKIVIVIINFKNQVNETLWRLQK